MPFVVVLWKKAMVIMSVKFPQVLLNKRPWGPKD